MLTNSSQHNLTLLKYLKKHIKPHPNPPWGKPCFRIKSKMAAIIKPVIYIYIYITIISETKHRRTTYNMLFSDYFFTGFYLFTFQISKISN